MQTLWIDGRPVAFTPRGELRLALRGGLNMAGAELNARRGLMSRAALDRFERIWAIGTATEHPRTRGWPLERWSNRRERVRAAVRGFLAKARADGWTVRAPSGELGRAA